MGKRWNKRVPKAWVKGINRERERLLKRCLKGDFFEIITEDGNKNNISHRYCDKDGNPVFTSYITSWQAFITLLEDGLIRRRFIPPKSKYADIYPKKNKIVLTARGRRKYE